MLDDEFEIEIKELSDYTDGTYEVWDEIKKQWIEIKQSCYWENGGFSTPDLANNPIVSITMKINSIIYVFGCGEFIIPEHYVGIVKYIKCFDELDLIERFLDVWSSDYPDVITGWSIKFFDGPYIINRIRKLFGEDKVKKLSPWGHYYKRSVILMGKEQEAYVISGIATFDYLELYRKFAKGGTSRENYKLDTIANIELGEKKLSYSEYGSLHMLYKENYQKFIEYNIKDVVLVEKIDQKLKLIDLGFTLAYSSKSNYDDIFMQTRMWDNIIYNWLWERNIIIPPKTDADKDSQFVGAAVKEPQIGRHRWVVSFDLTSLYPHIQMQYNLSPETLVEDDELENRKKILLAELKKRRHI